MKPRGHVIKNHDGSPNHHFLNEATTLLAKLNGVSGVKDIASGKVHPTSKRRPCVAEVHCSGVDKGGQAYAVVRYFGRHNYQDMTVECDVHSVGRIAIVVDKYARDYEGARERKTAQRELQNY